MEDKRTNFAKLVDDLIIILINNPDFNGKAKDLVKLIENDYNLDNNWKLLAAEQALDFFNTFERPIKL